MSLSSRRLSISANAATTKLTPLEAHRRFGHIAPAVAKRLVTHGFVAGVELDMDGDEPTFCESCVYAKSRRQSIPKVRQGKRATSFGEEFTPMFGDHHLSNPWVVVVTSLPSLMTVPVTLTFTFFAANRRPLVPTRPLRHGLVLSLAPLSKTLHSDRGGEYMSAAFENHLKAAGTVQKLTVHDTPEENGVSERLNGIVLERVVPSCMPAVSQISVGRSCQTCHLA
jgi:hypothetical protein